MKNVLFKFAWLCMALFFAIAVFSSKVAAQAENQFIKPATWGLGSLDAGQQVKVSSLQQRPGVVSVQFIDIGDLSSIQQNGWLDLNIPGKGCTARVKAKHIESFSNGDYFWYGSVAKEDGTDLEGCQCYDGTVNILSSEGRIAGTLKVDEDFYEIHDLGSNKRLLVKKDYTGLDLRCANEGNDGFQDQELSASDRTEGNCPVKVLALYTPAAGAALPDILGTINLTIKQTNQAFRNSNVAASDLTLNLVGINTVSLVETSSLPNDLNSLISLSELRTKRDAADADIVLVFVQGDYTGLLGIAGTLTLQSERAVTVINTTDALFDYNTCHELAHLFGCRHEPSADPNGPIEHAHAFKTGCWPFRKERNTVMFSVATGNTIQHFSNPNVEYKNKKTGVTNERENWQQLKTSACIVAGFRDQSNPSLQATISGSGYGCPCQNASLFALVTGGAPGNYILAWQTSTDGFNWSPIQGTGSWFSVELPCEEGKGVYVQLTATSINGQVATSFRYIEAATAWYGQEGPCMRSDDNIGAGKFGDISVYPNPNDGTFIVLVNSPEDNISIEVHDQAGRLVFISKENSFIGRYEKYLNIGHLISGTYSVRVRTNDKVFTQKIIKQ